MSIYQYFQIMYLLMVVLAWQALPNIVLKQLQQLAEIGTTRDMTGVMLPLRHLVQIGTMGPVGGTQSAKEKVCTKRFPKDVFLIYFTLLTF